MQTRTGFLMDRPPLLLRLTPQAQGHFFTFIDTTDAGMFFLFSDITDTGTCFLVTQLMQGHFFHPVTPLMEVNDLLSGTCRGVSSFQ